MRGTSFTLTELIHEGPDTVLHRARRIADQAPVLVKLLKDEYPSPRALAQLRHEYLICRDLDLPGVVKPWALEAVANGLSLILEDCGGRPLDAILAEGRLDLGAALQIAASLAETLGAIHDRRVIHRDVKPHHILVDQGTGQVTLTGFGIATRLSQETPRAERPDALEGTLAYMSPEQTGRTGRPVDARTDLYSLGATLYEMLTGALPFSAKDPAELLHSHIARAPAPPHERAKEVPRAVSELVMKLLAKAAEDRYQSAWGLKADLDTCLAAWRAPHAEAARGDITPFPLGRRDAPSELRLPHKLYGRQREAAALLEAFSRAQSGEAELLLIKGQAGVGKSALVRELHQEKGRRGGYFVSGKFEQLTRGVPYTAMTQALRELVRALLAEPADTLGRYKRELLAALGTHGQLLIDLIPELVWVLGPQPAVPELEPKEAQNRFALVFQDFLRVFSARATTLVIFLDDLQWADRASLDLVALLLRDPARGHLLLLGAYRDHDVGPAHRLSLALDDLRKHGAQISEIALEPLGLADVTALVADTLGEAEEEIAPLARLMFDKTRGNAFFLGRFLRALHAEERIRFDRGAGRFRWDIERVREAAATENVVELMAAQIDKLAPRARALLQLAACVGHRFDSETLRVIQGATSAEVAEDLWEAQREGLVVPLAPEPRFLVEAEPSSAASPAAAFDVAYAFAHDRVQQAAYASLDEGKRKEVHLRVARLLRPACGSIPSDERIFVLADHLNFAAELIQDSDERIEAARWNLAAGKRARAATAHEAAVGYFRAGAAFVGEAGWGGDTYALAFALNVRWAESEYLSGHFEAADGLFEALLSHARTTLDQALVHTLIVTLRSARGDLPGVARAGLEGLRLFGVELPEAVEQQRAALTAELAQITERLRGLGDAELIDAPALTDPAHLARVNLLSGVMSSVYFINPITYALISAQLISFLLEHGNAGVSAFAFASFGFVLTAFFQRFDEARRFVAIARALVERTADPRLRGKAYITLSGSSQHFEHLRAQQAYLRRALRAAVETSDFASLANAAQLLAKAVVSSGEELSAAGAEIEQCITLLGRAREPLSTSIVVLYRQMIRSLQGRTRRRTSLSDGDVDEAAFVEGLRASSSLWPLCSYHTIKLNILFLAGDIPGALEHLRIFEELLEKRPGLQVPTEVPFYAGLTLAAAYPSASATDQERIAARMEGHLATLKAWAAKTPVNFEPRYRLVSAEAARIAGRDAEAWEFYEQAIAAAQEGEFGHYQAMANELAARFHLGRGNLKVARVYLGEAHHGYLRWGATVKASDLAAQHPDLLLKAEPEQARAGRIGARQFDAEAVIRATQAIAGEIELEKLLDRLMRILAENAGADRGLLLLVRDERLVIEAAMTVNPDMVQVGPPIPLDEGAPTRLARSVVQFVARTREPVVLGDAAGSHPFAGDLYLAERPPRSLLCLAMTHQGELAGILYLENQAARDAFTAERVELAGLLAAQAATAVENALLVAGLQRRTEELAEAKGWLERELFEREQAEAARAALQRELVRVRTPLIPITDQIVVMPLVGALDAERAQQVLEAALRGAHARRAQVVILDVTGLERGDAAAMRALSSTARALSLLGAQAVITGIQPAMAQVLVEEGVDLGAAVTEGTLQSGIAFAMHRLRLPWARAAQR